MQMTYKFLIWTLAYLHTAREYYFSFIFSHYYKVNYMYADYHVVK